MSEELAHLCPPVSAGEIKKGDIVMIKGHPCKISESKHSKTGKHGSAKCAIVGIDVVTGKKYTEVQPAHITMKRGLVAKEEVTYCAMKSAEEKGDKKEDVEVLSVLNEDFEEDEVEVFKNSKTDDNIAKLREILAEGADVDITLVLQKAPYSEDKDCKKIAIATTLIEVKKN